MESPKPWHDTGAVNLRNSNDDAEEVSNRLHIELVPGTEILTDLKTHSFVHGGGTKNVVLVPQPSSDIHDPLNWKPWWKYVVLLNMSFYMFLGNFSALSIAPLTPIFEEAFDISLSKVALLTGACILALGYANFIVIPCTNIYGRRPVALVCGLICIGANIWQSLASSYNSMLGARILIGLGAATSESMMPVVISDIMFLHERGAWMGIYFYAFFAGAWLGPIISGNIGAHISWRWFLISFVALCVAFPETKYKRENSSTRHPLPSGAVDLGFADDGVLVLAQNVTDKANEEFTETIPTASQNETLQVSSIFGHGYPSTKQRWKILSKADPIAVKLLPRDIVTPIQIATFPIVLFAACCTGFGANSLLVLNLTESPAFSGKPYGFSPSAVGFVNFALVVGGIVGLLTAGPFSDWVSMVLTKRNRGIREPEMRLPSFIPFIIIGLIGMTVAAVGFEHKWHWEAIVVIGFGFSGVMIVAIPTIGITYAVDSYKPVAGQIMVVATVVKNTFGFGMTYFINDWAIKSGYIPPIMTLAALSCGIPSLGLVVFGVWGKRFRKLTKNSKVHDF